MNLFREGHQELGLRRTRRSSKPRRKRFATARVLGSCSIEQLGMEQLESRVLLTSVTDPINLAGPFSANLNVSNANISIGAFHSTFKQWVLFTHVTVHVDANNQTANLSMSPVNANNLPASGSGNMSFDDVTPGTFQSFQALNMDLNGAGGSNVPVPFQINATPVTISASGINVSVIFTINGQLSDLRFDSTGPSTPGSPFLIPGNFTAVLQANVDAKLVLPFGLGNLDLGNLTSIGPLTETFHAEDIGGVTLNDQGGVSFPHDLHVDVSVNLSGVSVSLPLTATLNTSQDFPDPGSGHSGLTHIDLQNTTLNGTLTLSNIQYDFGGVIPGALVANVPPVVDLNGAAPGSGYTTTWTGAAPVAIADPANATVSDVNGGNLASLQVVIANFQPGDVLAANTNGTPIAQSYSGGTLSLSGTGTIDQYQNILRSITYTNTNGTAGVSTKTLTVTANDGMADSAPAVATINMPHSSVTNRLVFYKGSPRFDGIGGPREPLPFSDDNAVAVDKSAYLPGSGATTFANVSSYTSGINGLIVDLSGPHGAITANDFIFKTGNNNSPGSWTTVAAAATVTTRSAGSLGLPAGGPDRIEITFPDNAIQNTWLEVIVKGNDTLGGNDTHTGLAASDVFFWGSAVADGGNTPDDAVAYRTDASDELDARNNSATMLANIPITNLYDFNRDGTVGAADALFSRNNVNTNLTASKILNISGSGPFAPDAAPAASQSASVAAAPLGAAGGIGNAAVALGIDGLAGIGSSSLPSGLQNGPLNIYPQVLKVLETLQHSDSTAGSQILQTVDQVAHKFNLHDDLLDGLLADLGL